MSIKDLKSILENYSDSTEIVIKSIGRIDDIEVIYNPEKDRIEIERK